MNVEPALVAILSLGTLSPVSLLYLRRHRTGERNKDANALLIVGRTTFCLTTFIPAFA